jgi:hypothetical protein
LFLSFFFLCFCFVFPSHLFVSFWHATRPRVRLPCCQRRSERPWLRTQAS